MNSKLIVMLTHNDKTVNNAIEVFESCKDLDVDFWGFKEAGIPIDEMKDLVQRMKKTGKTTFLEVVEYEERECINGIEIGIECGFDYMMGTMFSPAVFNKVKESNMKYMPFIGKIHGRPSVLEGEISEIVAEGVELEKQGVAGIDLLGYRYTGSGLELAKAVNNGLNIPMVMAGSINGYKRLDEVKELNPWAFTIGSALFDGKFGDGGTFREQLQNVIGYIK